MTKHTDEFLQFAEPVTCREYILPRDEKSTDSKGWIRGTTKIGPVLEVTTSYLQGKYGVEIRIESVNKDNSHSWVRISHGLNKLVTNLNNKDQDDKEQETSEMQFEECALKLSASDFACRSKAKAKPQRRDSASSSTRTLPIGERTWTGIEPQEYSLSDYPVSKKLTTLLRHGSLPRDNDGADQRLKQHREDLPLLAHLQEFYLFLKAHGLISNHELNSIKRTQWQKDLTLFFGTENYLEKKMGRSNSGD